ncbi:hypothetical protein [Arthrobacter sp.]|nr:hypothetical protein [Arthrobacter sp.]MDO5754414.1 hypothetical protein [Arthrobacter sp.]
MQEYRSTLDRAVALDKQMIDDGDPDGSEFYALRALRQDELAR